MQLRSAGMNLEGVKEREMRREDKELEGESKGREAQKEGLTHI